MACVCVFVCGGQKAHVNNNKIAKENPCRSFDALPNASDREMMRCVVHETKKHDRPEEGEEEEGQFNKKK